VVVSFSRGIFHIFFHVLLVQISGA
jgi:hypothetical protein